MSTFSGLMGGSGLTYRVWHQVDIYIESRTDGSGKYKTLAEAKQHAREAINYSNWSKAQKSRARQQVTAMTVADFDNKQTTRTISG